MTDKKFYEIEDDNFRYKILLVSIIITCSIILLSMPVIKNIDEEYTNDLKESEADFFKEVEHFKQLIDNKLFNEVHN